MHEKGQNRNLYEVFFYLKYLLKYKINSVWTQIKSKNTFSKGKASKIKYKSYLLNYKF